MNTKVIQERALTIFLNNQEIVTLMSIGDHPKYLSVGYLLNQNMLKVTDKIKNNIPHFFLFTTVYTFRFCHESWSSDGSHHYSYVCQQ